MKNLFNSENPLFRFLDKLTNLILLNILFILCCLPIITAGASATAMFYVTLRMRRKQDAYIIKDFFHSFFQNLKQGIVIHIIFIVVTILLGIDLYVLWKLLDIELFYKILFGLISLITLMFTVTYLYVYPVLAQFNNTTLGTLRTALFMALKHLAHTIAILLITIFPLFAGLCIQYILEWEILFAMFFGFSGMAYINSHFFVIVFDKYISENK